MHIKIELICKSFNIVFKPECVHEVHIYVLLKCALSEAYIISEWLCSTWKLLAPLQSVVHRQSYYSGICLFLSFNTKWTNEYWGPPNNIWKKEKQKNEVLTVYRIFTLFWLIEPGGWCKIMRCLFRKINL